MRNINFHLCLIISGIYLISCLNNPIKRNTSVYDRLTNDSIKFWDVHQYFDRYFTDSAIYCYSFKSDGTYQRLYYEKNTGSRRIYNPLPDVAIPDKWDIKSDTLIIIGNSDFIIRRITWDTLILETLSGARISMHSSR